MSKRKSRRDSLRELLTGRPIPVDRERISVKVRERQQSLPKLSTEARLSPKLLETTYKNDELVWAIVNKYVTVLLPDYMIIGEEPYKSAIEKFCKRTHITSVLSEAVRDSFVYGWGAVELVENVAGNDIVKLVPVDVKTLDLIRNAETYVVINEETKEPVGFEQELYTYSGKKEVKIPWEKIVILKFFGLSGSWLGYSPIESLYHTILVRKNLEKATGEVGARKAMPTWVAEVGSEQIEPTPEEIDDVSEELERVGERSVIVTPYYVKVRKVEGEKLDQLEELQQLYINMICKGFLIPTGIMGGTLSKAGSYGSLDRQALEWERTVMGLQEIMSAIIEEQIFERYLKKHDMYEIDKVPQIKWKTESPTIKLSYARLVATLGRAGLLQPSRELDNFLREKYGLPIIPEDTPYVGSGKGATIGVIRDIVKDLIDDEETEPEEEEEPEEE
jgi:hypothetical protein